MLFIKINFEIWVDFSRQIRGIYLNALNYLHFLEKIIIKKC